MFLQGIDVNMEAGDRHYLKFLGLRQPHNPVPSKVSVVAICHNNGVENGPLGVSFAWNDGTGDVNQDWGSMPPHLKLGTPGNDFFGF